MILSCVLTAHRHGPATHYPQHQSPTGSLGVVARPLQATVGLSCLCGGRWSGQSPHFGPQCNLAKMQFRQLVGGDESQKGNPFFGWISIGFIGRCLRHQTPAQPLLLKRPGCSNGQDGCASERHLSFGQRTVRPMALWRFKGLWDWAKSDDGRVAVWPLSTTSVHVCAPTCLYRYVYRHVLGVCRALLESSGLKLEW